MSPRLLPVFAQLQDRLVLVVGGGEVAARKVEVLVRAGARVRVGAPTLVPRLAELAARSVVVHQPGHFEPDWLDDAWLVVAATDDPAVNRRVAAAAEARRLFVNVVDCVELSSIQLPAVVERGRVQVAVSTGGAAPMLATYLRERLECWLDHSIGALAELLQRQRARIRRRFPILPARRAFFRRLLSGHVPALLRQSQPAAAERALLDALERHPSQASTGTVALVGAGPGDPGLLTLRALHLLQQADLILHDRLVDEGVLSLARRDAERIEVGKRAGGRRTDQADIHALMLAHARAGHHVVRLKGGDPFVFGRGGEELEFLRAHGIPYEVVPGITAALACSAYAGVPLTHRDHAQSVRLVTAHCKDSLDTLDWPALAAERQTLAVYMGVANLTRLRDRLIAHGRSGQAPFALVENGSRPNQRVLTGVLAELPEFAREHRVTSPALLILGEVAALANTLHWFGDPPLAAASPLAEAA